MDDAVRLQSLLVSSLTDLAKNIESVVKRTREDFSKAKDDLYRFLTYSNDENYGIMKLFGVAIGYAECMTKVGVKNKAELEQLWEQHYGDSDVKDAVGSLLKAERNYSDFLDEVEQELSPLEYQLTVKVSAQVGQAFPKEHTLIAIPSGQTSSPEECWKGSKFTLFVFLRLFG